MDRKRRKYYTHVIMGIWGKGLAATLAVGIYGDAVSAQTLTIGSKNFVEQYIVAELYAVALEQAGYTVSRRINLGPTPVVHEALRRGAIDLYPEYTGTGLTVVMKASGAGETDAQKVYATVKAHYEKEFKLTWLKPSGVNNGHAMVVRRETAQSMNLRTLSDLAGVAGRMRLGAAAEFADRRDGLVGLREVYGIEFGEYRRFPVLRMRYDALQNGDVDVVVGFATDGHITAEQFSILKDDKLLFPPYFLAPVMRMDIAANNPRAVEALERVGALLDDATMRELNRRVAVDRMEPRQVAVAFLKAKGIVH